MAGLAKSSSRSEMNSSWMTWRDVLLQCLQPMLAVVLLMRFSSIVDEAGFVVTLLLVFLTFSIGFVTAWSACTVVSRNNGDGGFLKTLISYSSPHFATSFAFIHFLALILATSIFVSSGAEAVLHIFSTFEFDIFDGATHDLRIVAAVLSVIVLSFCFVRNRNGRHTRFFILVLTIIAVVLHLSGVMFRYGEYQLRRIPERNVVFTSPPEEELSTIFAQLFPASICSLTILNFSSKLQSSAPRGSLLAILIATIIYGCATLFDYVEFFSRATPNSTLNGEPKQQFEQLSYIYTTVPMAIVITISCILSGVSTLKYSSNILRSLCRYSQNNHLLWLSRGYTNRDIPIRCLLIISICQTLFSFIGSYDILCIPTTVIFLVIYALFNFYVFLVKLSDDQIPSPPPLISLIISSICIFLAIYTNRHFTFLAGFLFAFCYCAQIYFDRDQQNERSEGTEKTTKYIPVLEQMHELQQEADNSRHYHPQILLLSGSPTVRPALVDFAHSITRGKSLLICGYVIPQNPCSRSYLLQLKIDKQINDYLRNREVNAFGSAICCENQSEGANTLLQTVGLGRLRPNILMVGFKTNWDKMGTENLQTVVDYYGMLSNAFEKQVGLIVFRNEISGFDVSSSIRNKGEPINNDEDLANYNDSQSCSDIPTSHPVQEKRIGAHRGKILSSMQTTFRKMSKAATRHDIENGTGKRFHVNSQQQKPSNDHDEKVIMAQMFRFRKHIPNARIDVFWLREAGGLTMLVPYLLTQVGSFLEGAHIRVFTKTDADKDNMKKINEEQKTMAAVLRKFKIDSSDLHILPEFHKAPSQKMIDEFNRKIKPFKVSRDDEKLTGMFDDDDLFNLRGKTRNYLRAAELITEHSSDADLIVCTLPSARPGIPSTLYMTWIDILSRQTPPTCLIRGNQVSINAMKLKFP